MKTSRHLERKLRSVSGPWDRLPLLVGLCEWYCENDPRRASAPAFEALHIAKRLGDRFWVAQGHYAVGRSLVGQDRFSEILFYLDQAAVLFDRLQEPYRKEVVDHHRARTYEEMGEIERAMKLALANLNFFEKRNDEYWNSKSLLLVGSLYRGLGRQAESLQYCIKGLRLAKKHGFVDVIGHGYLLIGILYERMEDLERAIRYLHKYLWIAQSHRSKSMTAIASANLASLYLKKMDKRRAREYATQAQSLYNQLGYVACEAMQFEQLATLYRCEHDIERALFYNQKAIDMLEGTENKLLMAYAHKNIAITYGHQGKSKLGIPHLLKALEYISPFDDLYYKSCIYEALASVYEDVGDSDNALKYYRMYAEAKDNYAGAEKQRRLKEEESRFRIEKIRRELRRRDREVVTLQETNKRTEAELLVLALELSQKNEALSKLRSNGSTGVRRIRPAVEGDTPTNWEAFAKQFHKVHHDFYFNLVRTYPDLSPTEIKVCSLIRIGLSSKEIASILCISKRTVDSHREHIHKKLRLTSRTLLTRFIASL